MTSGAAEMQGTQEKQIFAGKDGYAALTVRELNGVAGALLRITNPTNKVNTVPPESIVEINQALDAFEAARELKFLILYGTEDKIHAGADVNMFAGGLTTDQNPPDFEKVRDYLLNGAKLDLRIKEISRKRLTISVMHGERFGGSVEWPLMTKYCVAAFDAAISLSEVTIGIVPGWSGILNVMLKSGAANALYLGTTGKRVSAQQMLEAGIVSCVVAPESALDVALHLATKSHAQTEVVNKKRLASEEEWYRQLAARMNPQPYEELAAEATKKKEQGTDPKELSKFIDKKLEELGKPLAPLAVEAVFGLVAKYGARASLENFDAIRDMAIEEAELCSALMKTRDRVIGINSVLKARENPVNKIALYKRQ